MVVLLHKLIRMHLVKISFILVSFAAAKIVASSYNFPISVILTGLPVLLNPVGIVTDRITCKICDRQLTPCKSGYDQYIITLHEIIHVFAKIVAIAIRIDVFNSRYHSCTAKTIWPEIFILSFNQVVTICPGQFIECRCTFGT